MLADVIIEGGEGLSVILGRKIEEKGAARTYYPYI